MPITTRSLPIIEKKLELYEEIVSLLDSECVHCMNAHKANCTECEVYQFVQRARDIAKMTDY